MCSVDAIPLVIQAVSAVGQGQAKEEELQANADQASFMAKQKLQEAGFVQDAAANQAKAISDQANEFGAKQETAMASSGISGKTAENIAIDTISKEQQDLEAIRYNADWETFNKKQEAWGYKKAEAEYRIAKKNTQFNTIIGLAAGSFNQNKK